MRSKFVLPSIAVSVVLSGAVPDSVHAQDKQASQARSATYSPPSKDEQVIRKSAQDFAGAFEKGDAKAIAALWTAQGEYEDDTGRNLRGREAIEKAFAEFFQQHPGSKSEAIVKLVRFPSPDLAVEDGILRQTSAGKDLPSTTAYRALHARENGQWKIALCQEWGADQDHLDDLNWLAGTWKGAAGDQDMTLTFKWDDKLPVLVGSFTKNSAGKPGNKGTMKVGFDPAVGRLWSSHADEDGGHGRAHWQRDGNRWMMHSTGTTADGQQTAAVNVLGRLDNDNLTWRSIDRSIDGQVLPDSAPIKLQRVTKAK